MINRRNYVFLVPPNMFEPSEIEAHFTYFVFFTHYISSQYLRNIK